MVLLSCLQLLIIGVAGKNFVPLELPADLDDPDADQVPEHQKHLYEAEPELPEEKGAVAPKKKEDALKNILGRRHAVNAIGQVQAESKTASSPAQATQVAQIKEEAEEEACPSTFVYNLEGDLGKSSAPSGTLEGVFGEELRVAGWAGGAYSTQEDTLLEIMLYRLRLGKRCPQVSHPDLADLFLVPILPSANAETWEKHCTELVESDWKAMLPFLEERTAAKHILIMPEPDVDGHTPCGRFWHYLPFELRGTTILTADIPADQRLLEVLPPTIKIVPRPTSVHWSSVFVSAQQNAPWADWQKPRPIFASFFGGVHGLDKFKMLRTHLRDTCDKDSKCEMIVKSDGHATQELREDLVHILKSKRRSTFCMEPPGTTVARQSLVQSILSGCIPVIFDKQQDNLFPWHWGPWRKGSRVLLEVPRACFGSSEIHEECDILSQLHTLSEKRIQAMRKKIAKSAHSLQYALGDYEGDALDVILQEVRKISKEEEAKFPSQVDETVSDKSSLYNAKKASSEMGQHEQYL